MTSNTQASTNVDQVLQETEVGTFIAKNKSLVIGAVVGILIAIVGHGFYKQSENKTNDKFNEAIFSFKESSLIPFAEKKIKSDELVTAVEKVVAEVGDYKGLNLMLMNTSDELVKQNELEKAMAVLQKVSVPEDVYTAFFLASRKAAILEDLNRPAEALAELEGLSETSKTLLEGKVYLDMGRLQMKLGDTVKARSSFEYLQNKIVQEEFSKMAKFYLSQLDKQAAPTEAAPAPENK